MENDDSRERQIATIWSSIFKRELSLGDAFHLVQAAAFLQVVGLNVTPTCNLFCKHCFYGVGEPADPLLSFEEWQKLIDEFIDLGVRHFHIYGREPFVDKITLKILNYLRAKKNVNTLRYGVITNGTFLGEFRSEISKTELNYLDFSIDGLQEDHDFLRAKGTFQATTRNLKWSISEGVGDTIYVSTVIHKKNYKNIPQLIEYLHSSFGAYNFFLQPMQIHGRAVSLAELSISPEQYGAMINSVYSILEKLNKNGISVVVYIHQTFLPTLLEQNKFVALSLERYFSESKTSINIGTSILSFRFHVSCLSFWRQCQITPDGYYIGCCMALSGSNYWEYAVGNVKYTSVRDLYQKSIGKNSLLDQIYQSANSLSCKCKDCYFLCSGGCRVSAHITSGSWKSIDSSCPIKDTKLVGVKNGR